MWKDGSTKTSLSSPRRFWCTGNRGRESGCVQCENQGHGNPHPHLPLPGHLPPLHCQHILQHPLQMSCGRGERPSQSRMFSILFVNLKDFHENTPPIASKFELDNPEIDPPASYSLARKFGLAPEPKAFLFKMVQSLLPTRERLARVGKVQSPACTFCEDQEDNLAHLLTCIQGSEVTKPLIRCLTEQYCNISLALLNISTSESMELPVVWLLSTVLMRCGKSELLAELNINM